MCSIPGIFSSSTKMPFPLTSRFSSLRRMGWPTHFAADALAPFAESLEEPRPAAFFLVTLVMDFPAIRPISSLGKRLLQPVNQLLHILYPQRFEQAAGQRNHASQHPRLARPCNVRPSARQFLKFKLRANRGRSSRNFAFPLVHRFPRTLILNQRHFHRRRSPNVRNAHAQLHQEILRIQNLHALKVRQQRAKPFWVHQEAVHLLRRLLHREIAGQLDLHRLPLLHFRRRHANGLENILIAGTPARVPRDALADLRIRWPRMFPQQLQRGKQKPWRAIAALQPVTLRKGFLNRMQLAAFRKSFDSRDFSSLGHRRKQRARLHRAAIQDHRARATVGRIAAQMRAGQVQMLAKELHQQRPRLHFRFPSLSIHAGTHKNLLSVRHTHALLPPIHPAPSVRRSRWPASPERPPACACNPLSRACRSADPPRPSLLPRQPGYSFRPAISLAAPLRLPSRESPSTPRSPKRCAPLCTGCDLPVRAAPMRSPSDTPERCA